MRLILSIFPAIDVIARESSDKRETVVLLFADPLQML